MKEICLFFIQHMNEQYDNYNISKYPFNGLKMASNNQKYFS